MTSQPGDTLQVEVQFDGWEVTQGIQDLHGSVPLINDKRTFVRVYLSPSSGALAVRDGQFELSWSANGPWTEVDSLGTASLDASRKGSTLADLRNRRENFSYSLNFKLPERFLYFETLWIRLKDGVTAIGPDGSSTRVPVTNRPDTRMQPFVESPELRIMIVNFRYTNGTPARSHQATNKDLDNLRSWLERTYPVPFVAGVPLV